MQISHHPLEINLGPLPITGFGIAVLLAFIIGQILSQQELQRRGHQKEADAIPDLILASVIGTLVGGKLYYAGIVTQDW
ncbi:prolipoprotein diacylglyceryl transferase family protein, partial [Bradyrhizobium sp. NBAIM08]|uniref:prolipoprotein diacylglyceryl transferase family protein n=1 Tax=Bradyrhizobium sp. NBAIM08 TaxID=2793815 RepID=UPI001CD4D5C3|nr:prolipoprotein diacylglyceryl transferase [Bradyrhizobium sp. NBAIM08]